MPGGGSPNVQGVPDPCQIVIRALGGTVEMEWFSADNPITAFASLKLFSTAKRRLRRNLELQSRQVPWF